MSKSEQDIAQRLRGHYVTGLGDRRDFSPFVPPICIEAAGEIDRLRKLLEEAEQQERIIKLDKFFREAMHDYWLQNSNFDLAELAKNLGLAETKLMNKPCGENCMCTEQGGEFPLRCLRFIENDK